VGGDSTQMTGRNVTIKVGLFPVYFLFPYFSFALSNIARNKFISFIFLTSANTTTLQEVKQNIVGTESLQSINLRKEQTT